ncbi:MAG: GNAT family N-acetyltransferase [Pseudooceanicola sp.]
MTPDFRPATRAEVPAVVALLADDHLGAGRESVAALEPYMAAFDRMQAESSNHLIVGELQGRVVATYQLTFISGLGLKATRRAQVESVRVASDLRGGGIGALMMADAEARARSAGCGVLQLTTNSGRDRAQAFYAGLGFDPSHVGFKKTL